MPKKFRNVIGNPWEFLRQFTPARLALGRAGESLPTQELLKFQLAHARARDAVHSSADFERIQAELATNPGLECLELHSAARDRWEYLKRPDLGRELSSESLQILERRAPQPLAIVVGDGLSATAINCHALPLLRLLHRSFAEHGLKTGPIVLVREARVALGDEIGEKLGATATLVLIGERPGLSNVESIGAYLTYGPRKGRTDAERNCISNICPAGLPLRAATEQILRLLLTSLKNQVSGVKLGDVLALLDSKKIAEPVS